MPDKPQMLIAIDQHITQQLIDALYKNTLAMEQWAKREQELLLALERNRLMTEDEAMAYLKRDAGTLRYYRTLGLVPYKQGKERWYTKGQIDDWLGTGKVNRHSR